MEISNLHLATRSDPATGTNRPLYQQIERTLKEMVAGEEFNPGERIPSERDLAVQFGVSRMTVRKAVDNLAALGILERDSTSGTRVRHPNVTRGIGPQTTTSISKLLHDSGAESGSRLLFFEESRATKKMAARLNLEVGESLIVIRRLRLVNNKPFCIETSYLPKLLVPRLAAEDLLESASLYSLLETRFSICVETSDQIISVSYATEEEADLLDIKPSEAVLLQRSLVKDQEERPIEYVTSVNHPALVVFRSNGTV